MPEQKHIQSMQQHKHACISFKLNWLQDWILWIHDRKNLVKLLLAWLLSFV